MRYRERQSLTIDFWPGFIDALLAVVLVLLFLVLIFMLSQSVMVNVIGTKEAALAALSRQMSRLEEQLGLSRREAAALKGQLDDTSNELARTFARLLATETGLEKSQAYLDSVRTELTLTSSSLAAAQSERERQERRVQASAEEIRLLTGRLTEYLDQIQTLSTQLAATQKDMQSKDASLRDLDATARVLSDQVSKLNAQLGETKKQVTSQKLELGKLLDQIEARDKEISRLKAFQKYRSDFLARLSHVFEGHANIRVAGDRFVFQGEVLFASGQADLTVAGRGVLDKFYDTYKEFESKIPRDVGLNIQIQGHTDTDPIHTARYASNWELSVDRAVQVVRYLTLKGVPPEMLSAAGFSEFYPSSSGGSVESKRQNRRIEILFTRR